MYKILLSYITISIIIIPFIILLGCEDKSSTSMDSKGSEAPQPIKNDDIEFANMIFIPAGEFIMGNNLEDKEGKSYRQGRPNFVDEHPQRKVFVDAFYIAKYEVTNEEYKRFVDATGLAAVPAHWENGIYPPDKANHPVIFVNWYNAVSYAKWSGIRLPTEAEWEKAARGTDGRLWTWGNEYNPEIGNFGLTRSDTVSVGTFSGDKSPFGVFDMTGNVKEWTLDWYDAYSGNNFKYEKFGNRYKVVRGSSYIKYGHYYDKSFAMVTHRFSLDPVYATPDVGIRCAADA